MLVLTKPDHFFLFSACYTEYCVLTVIYMICLFLLVPQQVSAVRFEVDTTNSDPTVTITWEHPFSELPITHYWVAISENDTNQYSRRVDGDTSLRINVTSGSTYSATVMAVSAVGNGTPSEHVTAACEYILHQF